MPARPCGSRLQPCGRARRLVKFPQLASVAREPVTRLRPRVLFRGPGLEERHVRAAHTRRPVLRFFVPRATKRIFQATVVGGQFARSGGYQLACTKQTEVRPPW